MTKHRRLLLSLVLIAFTLTIGATAVYIALNSANQARPAALAAITSDGQVVVSRADGEDWYLFRPTGQTPDTGFIIYPGGFVDPIAYAAVARDIAAQGFFVVLDPMPLNLAVLAAQSATSIMAAFPEIEAWAIGGHSLGGAMAAEYSAGHPQAVDGLALWAAYPAESTDLSASPLQVVSIYGDADGVAQPGEITGAATRLPAGARFVAIPGGNHTQFGEYGQSLQRGDNQAGIGREEQRAIVVAATVNMLRGLTAN